MPPSIEGREWVRKARQGHSYLIGGFKNVLSCCSCSEVCASHWRGQGVQEEKEAGIWVLLLHLLLENPSSIHGHDF